MKTSEAVAHFGGYRKLAEVLDISTQAIYGWGEIVPEGRAYQLQVITDGALVAVPTAPQDAA